MINIYIYGDVVIVEKYSNKKSKNSFFELFKQKESF